MKSSIKKSCQVDSYEYINLERWFKIAFNLAEQGEGLGAFLTAIESPVTSFLLALVFLVGIGSIITAVVYTITNVVKRGGKGMK